MSVLSCVNLMNTVIRSKKKLKVFRVEASTSRDSAFVLAAARMTTQRFSKSPKRFPTTFFKEDSMLLIVVHKQSHTSGETVMITQWRLFNFKSVKSDTSLGFGPLTIFAGPNSSGKSTWIQSLLLLSQTMSPEPECSPVSLCCVEWLTHWRFRSVRST